jgi:hypothetical protein
MGLRGRLPPPPPQPPPFQHLGSHQPLAWLFVLGVVLLVGAVVYFAVRYASRPLAGAQAVAAATSTQDLLALVALRYANGQITRDEFLRMSADLGGAPVSAAEHPPPE